MQIKGIEFTTPALPYKAGHILKENEAAALNQTWLENIRNNQASTVQEEIDKAKAEGRQPNTKALQKSIDEYAASYVFGSGRQSDPVETRAMQLARDAVRKHLTKQNKKVKDLPEGELESMAKRLLDTNPKIREIARKHVEDAKKLRESVAGL